MKLLSYALILMTFSVPTLSEAKIFKLDKDSITEETSNILGHAEFIKGYRECIGEDDKLFMQLDSKGQHNKLKSPLRKLQKSLSWQFSRLDEVHAVTNRLLTWNEQASERVLEIPESDIRLLTSVTRKINQSSSQSSKTYYATLVWGEIDKSFNYTSILKCVNLAHIGLNDEYPSYEGRISFLDATRNNLSLAIGLPLNRLLGTERLVREDYLKWPASNLSDISALEDICRSAQALLSEHNENLFSSEYINQSRLLCDSINSNAVDSIKQREKEFYDLMLGILSTKGEIKMPLKSRYSELFKDHQHNIKATFKTIRDIQVHSVNYELILRHDYAKSYMAKNNSNLSLDLSFALDDLLVARGRGMHTDYFPYYKLIEWRNQKKLAEEKFRSDKNSIGYSSIKIADCILKDKVDYLSLDWSRKKNLVRFRKNFSDIEDLRDSLFLDKFSPKREKKLLKEIQKQKDLTALFLGDAKTYGNKGQQQLLSNLLSCDQPDQ